jgi:hypothetical protein
LNDALQESRNTVNEDEDGFLYHYTDLNALIGIISNKVLWASHIKYLNDTSEQVIYRQLVSNKIWEIDSSTDLNVEEQRLPERIRQSRTLGGSLTMAFVVCFSEDGGDRLSQWRAYGGNSGVCLKFNKFELVDYCQVSGTELRMIRYVAPEGGADLDWEIEKLVRAGRIGEVSVEGAFIKHKAFEEEQEWRVLMNDYKAVVKYRVRGSLLVPYVEFDLKSKMADLLQAVIVGPINHREQTAEAIKTLLESNGLQSVEVICSRTPYRGF